MARGQTDPVTQAYNQAYAKFEAGDYAGAAADFEAFIKAYPSSGVLRSAQLYEGYARFLAGDAEGALPLLKTAMTPPAQEKMVEVASLVLPQALVQKAATQPPGSAERKATLDEAVKLFDEYLKKYPQTEEAETVNYQKAVAAFQMEEFDQAIAALRENLTKFPQSDSIFDSQYLLALAYMNKASVLAQAAQGQMTEEAGKLFGESERLLRDIIAKRVDVALINDAHLQLGDLLSLRSSYAVPEKRAGLIEQAMDEYRGVETKERMQQAQEDRLNAIRARNAQARQQGDLAMQNRLASFYKREAAKLQGLKAKPDQTVAAKIRMGELYVRAGDYGAARVVLRFVEPFAEDPEQKKRINFNMLLSYAQQVPVIPGLEAKKELMGKALELNEQFQAAHPGDPLAEGLPLVLGSLYLDPTPGINDPEKAAEYFKKAAGKGGAVGRQAALREAAALAQLKRYDEAMAAYEKILTEKPPEATVAEAEFGVAAILKDQGKLEEARAAFAQVRKEHAESAQAEQSDFWVGQLAFQQGDAKGAAAELAAFAEKRPESALAPGALFALGKAKQALGDEAGALAAFNRIAEKYPQTDAAPFSYFERAAILGKQGEAEKMVELMREFIAKYPESPQLYVAYKSLAQQQAQKDIAAAAATYRSMVEDHPEHPDASDALLQIATLWQQAAAAMGQYVLLDDAARKTWDEAVTQSVASAEELLEKYPASMQVTAALQTLLAGQKMLLTAKKTTVEGIEEYLGGLAEKYTGEAALRSKIQFTLASFLFERDPAKALALMAKEYDPALKYAPGDLDLYGSALLAEKKVEESVKVYEKLTADYPDTKPDAPKDSPLEVQQAQAISLYGLGQALAQQGKGEESKEKFVKLKELYSWHPKLLQANYGIARSLYEEKKYEEAMTPLLDVIRATNAETSLRAKAMLLGGKIQEGIFEQAKAANKKKEADAALSGAIDYFRKIPLYFESETEEAAEGLWRAGQLLEVLYSRL